jgi:glycogen operon protein
MIIYESKSGVLQSIQPQSQNRNISGIIEKIPYLKKLGVNCIELLPIFEFDEFFKIRGPIINITGDHMKNFWGYDPIAYFAPKAGYASKADGKQVREFKDLVKNLHRNGIEVVLDVVITITGEGKENTPNLSFRVLTIMSTTILQMKGFRNFSVCTIPLT